MKRLLSLLTISSLVILTACSSRSYPTSDGYPYPTYPSTGSRGDDVIVTRDGRVIDRNGRVIGNTRNMPPGQAKKIYGAKSAKVFAPGQRKKGGYYDKHRRDDDRDRRDNDRDRRYEERDRRYDNRDIYDEDNNRKQKGKRKGKYKRN